MGASPRRLVAFSMGRHAARRALAAAGGPGDAAIPMGTDGLPRWPGGWVGSISHCPGMAVATAGLVASFSGLGVDVEPLTARVAPAVARKICSEGELEALRSGAGGSLLARFVLKEALAKALKVAGHPSVDPRRLEVEQGRARQVAGVRCSLWLGEHLGHLVAVAVIGR